MTLDIRPASFHDAERISLLIKSLAGFFTLHPKGLGAESFMASIGPKAIRETIESPAFDYFVGETAGDLAGLVGVRDNRHLFHLFVCEAYQGQGFGRLLWDHACAFAMAKGNPGAFTVNATPHAYPFYEKLGFRPAGKREEKSGIAYVPMRMTRNSSSGL